jgi:membrane-associated phospholipid phosphatase
MAQTRLLRSAAPPVLGSAALAPVALLCVFALLTWQVATHGVVTRIDVHVRDGIQGAAGSPGLGWLAAFGRGCADLGDQAPALLTLVAATVLTAWVGRSWRPMLIAGGAAVVLASVIPLKIWVGRPGPGEVVLGNAALGFFPSGHTADALCCYATAAYLLATSVWTGPAARRRLGALVVGLLAFTMFGLLWSNYHWLSDILGSLCWCGAWLLALTRCTAELSRRRSRAEAGRWADG